MWVWFDIIAQAWSEASGLAFTPQNVHDAYCLMFLPLTLPNGDNIPGETKRLNTKEMSEFLDKVQADAESEYGIQLPSPDDETFIEWARGYGML